MEQAERVERSDKGTVRVNSRDMAAMEFLGDMKAAYEPDLAVMLSRHTGRVVTESATKQTINRWRRAGLVDATKVLADHPRIVSLARNGAELLGERFRSDTSPWGHVHTAEISRVRLWLEEGSTPFGPVTDWRSEKRFRQDNFAPGADQGHVVDGTVTFASGVVAAVEVERTAKDAARLQRIVAGLTRDYAVTMYAAHSPRIRRNVEAAYERVKVDPDTIRCGQLIASDYPSELTA